MKFTVHQMELIGALNTAGKCLGSKNFVSILESYLFNIDGKKLQITASNMEVLLSTEIEIINESTKKLSIAIPGNKLRGLIGSLASQPIEFEIQQKEVSEMVTYQVKITAGKGVYTLPAEDGENFPLIENKKDIHFKLQSSILMTGLRKTVFAVSADELTAYSGLLLKTSKEGITFTGTNARVLSTYNFTADVTPNKAFVLPMSVLTVLQSIPTDEEIEISVDNRNIQFNLSDDTILKSILKDVRYPDYELVIPVDNHIESVVNRVELLAAFKRVNQLANPVSRTVRCKVNPAGFTISGSNEDLGEAATEEISHSLTGEEIEIGVDGGYIVNILSKLECENIYMTFSTPKRAIIISEEHAAPERKTNLMLIMPQFI